MQGDTGHSQISMVRDVYSHIIDDKSAQLLELISQSPELSEFIEALPVFVAATTRIGASSWFIIDSFTIIFILCIVLIGAILPISNAIDEAEAES